MTAVAVRASDPFVWAIRGYQRYISPLTPPMCRFTPTCSQYAVEALQVHGLARGSALATWRLLRCHPFHPGGHDPVPPPRSALAAVDEVHKTSPPDDPHAGEPRGE